MVKMRRVRKKKYIPIEDLSEIQVQGGKDVITTIDINIQEVAHEALLKSMKKFEAKSGCVIVMDVKTGAIKAISNIGYRADRTPKYFEDYNYAIGVKAEPGSTFKLASMLALFEDGYIKATDSIDLALGKHKFYGEEMKDASYHALRRVDIPKAFEISSNVGVAKLVNKYYNVSNRQSAFIERLKDMKLHLPTQISLSGEAAPFIKDINDKTWSGISIPWMSIGYESELTPLQILTFYNTIANRGKMMKPYLVSAIKSFDKVEQRFQPITINRQLLSPETIDFAHMLLQRVVHGKKGTARSIAPDNYLIAGKTGTAIANFKRFKQGREGKRYRASFAGFFPADNPQYSCIVVVSKPTSGFYGGTVAAPVFREIADFCYVTNLNGHRSINENTVAYNATTLPNYQLGYTEDFNTILKELSIPFEKEATADWTFATLEADTLKLKHRSNQASIMPDVYGMGIRDALYILENKQLKVRVKGVGKVKSQSIPPGRAINKIRTVTIILG